MKKNHTALSRVLRQATFLGSAFLVSTAALAQGLPDQTEGGLVRVKDSKMMAVYVQPGVDFSGYDQIILDKAVVAFEKNWERDYNRGRRSASGRVTDKDMQEIRDKLSEMFHEVFAEELTSNGYTLTDTPGENVLQIEPAIIDLDVTAPDLDKAGRSQTYAENAGSMTLVLELFDSKTGDALAKGMDYREDPARGFAQWQTSVSNRAAAKRLLKHWAELLRKGLDEARAQTGE